MEWRIRPERELSMQLWINCIFPVQPSVTGTIAEDRVLVLFTNLPGIYVRNGCTTEMCVGHLSSPSPGELLVNLKFCFC